MSRGDSELLDVAEVAYLVVPPRLDQLITGTEPEVVIRLRVLGINWAEEIMVDETWTHWPRITVRVADKARDRCIESEFDMYLRWADPDVDPALVLVAPD